MKPSQLGVLDHGHVQLLDVMGGDLTVVNAARVSFAKRSEELSEKDRSLIKYLAKHNHWTPFGHVQMTLCFKMPVFVARQFMRSTVGIVYNEVSRRYVDDKPEYYNPVKWRPRPDRSIKQGSGEGSLDVAEALMADAFYAAAITEADHAYQKLLDAGVAPEQARIVLPVSHYTEFWATMSLAAVARVYSLRIDPHAQWEVRQYAGAIGELVKPHAPVSCEALFPSST